MEAVSLPAESHPRGCPFSEVHAGKVKRASASLCHTFSSLVKDEVLGFFLRDCT